ncbi:MAG: hypothetical protein HY431_02970 [Candidatus Levybacteria bacterium]|nr:hypothetical protein [Candidatus Levybacteria bacterium]
MSVPRYEANLAPKFDPRSMRLPSPMDRQISSRSRLILPAAGGLAILTAGTLVTAASMTDVGPAISNSAQDKQPTLPPSPDARDYLPKFDQLKVEYPGRFRARVAVETVFTLAGDNELEVRRGYGSADVAHASMLRIKNGVSPKDAIITENPKGTPDITLVEIDGKSYYDFKVLPSGDPYLLFTPTSPDTITRDGKQKALALPVPFEHAPLLASGEVSPVVAKVQSPISGPDVEAVKEDQELTIGYRKNGVNVSEVIFADGLDLQSYILNPGTGAETYGIVVPYTSLVEDGTYRRDKVETAMRNAALLYRSALQKAPDEIGAFRQHHEGLSQNAADYYKGQLASLEQMILDKASFSGLKGSPFFQAFDLYDPATIQDRYPKNADFATLEGFFKTVSATLATNFGPFSEYVKTLPGKDRQPIRDTVNAYLDIVFVNAGYSRRDFPLIVQNYNELQLLFNG